ncbi:MAG: F-box protein, partial [Verrucomicrobia bacterium]|nr:F-box protein [Verrucomicrobiota bacterium]
MVSFDSLPTEVILEIFAYSGEKAGRVVCRGWENVANSDTLSRRILELIVDHVQKHPLKNQIKQLLPSITLFQDSKIPEGLKERKLLLNQIFSSLQEVIGPDFIKEADKAKGVHA